MQGYLFNNADKGEGIYTLTSPVDLYTSSSDLKHRCASRFAVKESEIRLY